MRAERRIITLMVALLVATLVAATACSAPTGDAGGRRGDTTRGSAAGTVPAAGDETDEQSDDAVAADGSGTTLAPTASELTGEGTTLPIVMKDFSSGYQKPTVMVSVGGGTAVPVLLDTGSTGLHVLASAAGTTGVTTTTTTIDETYVDGTVYSGVLASAPVTIGGVASTAPIQLALIQNVSCDSANPSCPTPNASTMVSDIGVYGTMGVSLSPSSGCAAPIYSPLLQLPGGETGFSIGFASNAGTITLGNQPPATGGASVALQASAYTPPSGSGCGTAGSGQQYPNGSGVWDVASAQLCWSVAGAAAVCGATTFDTGSESAGIAIADFPGAPTDGDIVTAGTTVVLTAPGSTAPLWTLTTGTTPGQNRVATSSPAASLLATTGGTYYWSGWVTYDAQGGRLVITPRPA